MGNAARRQSSRPHLRRRHQERRRVRHRALDQVVIDDCDVPECLASTLWERIQSLEDINAATKKIANAIHGRSEKPPVGAPPRHVFTAIDIFPNLNRQDQILLAVACDQTMVTGWPMVSYAAIHPQLTALELTDEEIIESFKILDNRYFISVQWVLGGGLSHFDVSPSTFESYLKSTQADYPLMVDQICLQILNHKCRSNIEIQKVTGYHPRVVNHVLSSFGSRGLLHIVSGLGGSIHVVDVSPELTRHFRNRDPR